MGLKVGVLGVGPVGEHIVRVLNKKNFRLTGTLQSWRQGNAKKSSTEKRSASKKLA